MKLFTDAWFASRANGRSSICNDARSDPSSFVRTSSCPFFSIAFDPHGMSRTTSSSILIISISCNATLFVNSQTFDCIIRRWLRSRRRTCSWPAIFLLLWLHPTHSTFGVWRPDILMFRDSEMHTLEGGFVAVAILWRSGWWGIQVCVCVFLFMSRCGEYVKG